MNPKLIDLLRCPLTSQPLRRARPDELEAINRALADGSASTNGRADLHPSYSAALVTVDGSHVYPVVDDIPVMLAEQALPTARISDFPQAVASRM